LKLISRDIEIGVPGKRFHNAQTARFEFLCLVYGNDRKRRGNPVRDLWPLQKSSTAITNVIELIHVRQHTRDRLPSPKKMSRETVNGHAIGTPTSLRRSGKAFI
jgi:hypothetical protein